MMLGPGLSLALIFSLGLASTLIVVADRIRPLLKDRCDAGAVQASHTGEPLRLGGLAVFFGLIAGVMTLDGGLSRGFATALLLSSTPVVLAGLLEDTGRRVSPLPRLVAAVASSVFALAMLNIWLPRGDIPLVDAAMTVAPVAIFFTVFFASGFCHALNLIDGMNGLAGVTVISAAVGLALIASQGGLPDVSMTAWLLAAAAFGFLARNWPVSGIFLGDAGAYGLGHVIAWLAISIVALAPDIAAPAVLLTLFWPIADTAHSILRRKLENRSMFEPDRMHLHQKIRRGMEIVLVGRNRRKLSNPVTTLFMLPMIVAPVATGVVLAHDAPLAWSALLVFSGLFAATHVAATRIAQRMRKKAKAEKRVEHPVPGEAEAQVA